MWSFMKAKTKLTFSGLLEKKEEKSTIQPTITNALDNNPRCVFIRTDAYKNKAEAKKAFFEAVSLRL